MDKYLFIILCGIGLYFFFIPISNSGQLTSYINATTLNSADTIPVVLSASNINANINWYNLKELISKNINWTDVKQFSITNFGGDHTGINWQGFGA